MIPRYTLDEMGRLWRDDARFGRWLRVELAVSEVLAEDGVVPADEIETLKANASFDVAEIEEIEKTTNHDVVAFVTCVARRAGDVGRHLHRGLTSSDVIDTAQSLVLVEATELIASRLQDLGEALNALGWEHAMTPMVGRTHGVHAEPMTFGLKVAVWYQEVQRHLARLDLAREQVAVGKLSGPVGTFRHLAPDVEARVMTRLGLQPCLASNQIVQRDRHAFLLSVLAGIGATLEKIALETRLGARTEMGELGEPFRKGQTGSSAMPHKRNPILCERLCGMARLLRANAMVAFENVALWHERDISHSSAERVILPDSFTALHYMLVKSKSLVEGLRVNAAQMAENLEATRGLLHSSRVLTALVDAGFQRETAYRIVQRSAMRVHEERTLHLKDLLAADPEVTAKLDAATLDSCFDLGPCLSHVPEVLQRALGPKPSGA